MKNDVIDEATRTMAILTLKADLGDQMPKYLDLMANLTVEYLDRLNDAAKIHNADLGATIMLAMLNMKKAIDSVSNYTPKE